MFYSQLLLSKKGALGIVWLAAHCLKRLKKDQVQQTDISSSVDKILDDEVPVVTHRILAFLLLGVVRIYSKKAEYLFQDCHEVMNKLCGLKTAKIKQAGIGVSQTRYHTITLPKRFELDAFDLELLEDQDLVGGNVRSHEHDMLAGRREKSGSTSGLLLKEKMPFSEAYSTAYTPPRDVFSSHHIDQDLFVGSSSNMNISLSGLDVLHGARFSLEDRLDPIALDEAEDVQLHDKLSNGDMMTNLQEPTNDMRSDFVVSLSNNKSSPAPSLEILRGTAFSLEDRLDPMILDEVEKEQLNDRPSNDNISSKFCGPVQDAEFGSAANPSPQGSDSVASLGVLHRSSFPSQHSPSFKMLNESEKGQGHDGSYDKGHEVEEEHVQHLRSRLNFQEDEPCDFTGSVDKAQPMGLKKLKFLEVVTPESVKCQIPENFPMSVVTPDSKLPAVGFGTPEVATVRTPATKERAKILKKKRNILFDSTTMVSNKVFKCWIDDPSDLKREKRYAPHTLLHVWKAHKLGHVSQSFFEPSISVISVDLGDLECKKLSAIKLVELSAGQDGVVKSPVVTQTQVDCEQIADIRSPEQPPSPIAPGTPVTHFKSVRSHEAGAVADSDILETTSSSESVEKCPSLSQTLELDFEFPGETISFEGDSRGKDTYSARTRMMGSYLGKKFASKKKQKEEQVLNLSRLLAGKTRKESARLFYEILVLKTQDCIDVEQENAYDDILVREKQGLSKLNIKAVVSRC